MGPQWDQDRRRQQDSLVSAAHAASGQRTWPTRPSQSEPARSTRRGTAQIKRRLTFLYRLHKKQVLLYKQNHLLGIAKTFCYNNKMFSSINKTFGCCSKIFGCSNKKFYLLSLILSPHQNHFFPCMPPKSNSKTGPLRMFKGSSR